MMPAQDSVVADGAAPGMLLNKAVTALRARGELSWRGDIGAVADHIQLDELGVDSIEWVALLLELESIGGFVLHNSELSALSTIGALRQLLATKSAGP